MSNPLLKKYTTKIALDAVLEGIADPARAETSYHIDPDYSQPMGQKGTEPENVHYGRRADPDPNMNRYMEEFLFSDPELHKTFVQFLQHKRQQENSKAMGATAGKIAKDTMCTCGHPFSIHIHPPDFGCPHEQDPGGGCGCKGATEAKSAAAPLPVQNHDSIDDSLNPDEKIFKRSKPLRPYTEINMPELLAAAGGKDFMLKNFHTSDDAHDHLVETEKTLTLELLNKYEEVGECPNDAMWTWCDNYFPERAKTSNDEKEAGIGKALLPAAALLGLGGTPGDATTTKMQPPAIVQKQVKPSNPHMDALVKAISRAEGAKPERNNPGNIVDFNTGKIKTFRNYEEGEAALREQLERIARGDNPNFDPDMTLHDAGLVYSNGDPNWAKNVASIMRVSQNIPIAHLIKGQVNTQRSSSVAMRDDSGAVTGLRNRPDYGESDSFTSKMNRENAKGAAVHQHETPTMLPQRDDMRSHLDDDVKDEIAEMVDKPTHEGVKIGNDPDEDENAADEIRAFKLEAYEAFLGEAYMQQEARENGWTMDELWKMVGKDFTNEFWESHSASLRDKYAKAKCPNCKESNVIPVEDRNFKRASKAPMAECGKCGSFFTI